MMRFYANISDNVIEVHSIMCEEQFIVNERSFFKGVNKRLNPSYMKMIEDKIDFLHKNFCRLEDNKDLNELIDENEIVDLKSAVINLYKTNKSISFSIYSFLPCMEMKYLIGEFHFNDKMYKYEYVEPETLRKNIYDKWNNDGAYALFMSFLYGIHIGSMNKLSQLNLVTDNQKDVFLRHCMVPFAEDEIRHMASKRGFDKFI